MKNEPTCWEVYDRYGNKIYMTAERWRHALEKRPWLRPYFDQVLQTIRIGRRRQDPLNQFKYKYYWPCPDMEPEYNHITVVVLFRTRLDAGGKTYANNYVLNVWAVYIYGKR